MHISDWFQRVDLGKEIQEVYLHRFLFKLAVKLVAIFIPLYLLELGFSVNGVILFFLAYYLTYIFLSFPNAKIASNFGYKHTSLLASPLILFFYFAMRNLQVSTPQLLAVGVLGGIGSNLYWTGMNPEIASSSHSKEREKETGYFFSMPALASIISPLIGGIILKAFTFSSLFLFTAVLVAASFLPFLFSREHHRGMEIDVLEFGKNLRKTDFLTFTLKGVNSIGKKVLWPLYLAIIIQNSLSIGGAGSVLALGSAVTSVLVGRIADEDNRSKILILGATIASASYLLMAYVTDPLAAVLVSGLNGLSYTAASIPIYSRAMDHSEQKDVVEYFAFREIAIAVGRITILVVMLGLFNFLSRETAMQAAFGTVSISVLMTGYFGSRM